MLHENPMNTAIFNYFRANVPLGTPDAIYTSMKEELTTRKAGKMKIVEVIDTRRVKKLNPAWPEYQRQIVGDTEQGDIVQILGRIKMVWVNNKPIGRLGPDRHNSVCGLFAV